MTDVTAQLLRTVEAILPKDGTGRPQDLWVQVFVHEDVLSQVDRSRVPTKWKLIPDSPSPSDAMVVEWDVEHWTRDNPAADPPKGRPAALLPDEVPAEFAWLYGDLRAQGRTRAEAIAILQAAAS